MRFAALLAVGVVVLAGCTAGPLGTDEPPSPTESPAGTCTEHQRETVDPYRDAVEPSELPERPDTLTRASVRDYVVAYERAYARNGRLERISTEVSTNVQDVSVSQTGNGWVVRLTSQTNTWAAGTDTADGTPTVVHGDGAELPVAYLLTDDRLVRSVGDYGETPSPSHGRVVECY